MKIIPLHAFKWLNISTLVALFLLTACEQPIPHFSEPEISEKQATFTTSAATNSNIPAHISCYTFPIKTTRNSTFTPESTPYETSPKLAIS